MGARAVWSTCPESTGVRMLRFFWAYGVGGLVNKELAQRARDWTVNSYATASKQARCTAFPSDGGAPGYESRLNRHCVLFHQGASFTLHLVVVTNCNSWRSTCSHCFKSVSRAAHCIPG